MGNLPELKQTKRLIIKYRDCYIMLIPVLAAVIVFRYIPIVSQFFLATSDYRFIDGILGSPKVGLKHFMHAFSSIDFPVVLKNTVIIATLRLATGFLPPIVLAIALNDFFHKRFARFSQTIVYLPHFLSWVIVYGIAYAFLSPGFGIINYWREFFGLADINMLIDEKYFRGIIIVTGLWKELGWSCIIYLAALSGIDPELYEAANIDGASVWRRILHITLPGIKPVVVFVLTLSMGSLIQSGFEQIFLFQKTANLRVSDTIETWVYRRGLVDLEYSFATAVGIFQSVVGLALVLASNKLAKRFTGSGIW